MVVSDKNAKNGDTNEAAYLSLPSPWGTAIIEHGYLHGHGGCVPTCAQSGIMVHGHDQVS